jgi:hypothetical protein
MRQYENGVVADFFKQQSWRCRAAIATLRNRMGDDWLDLFLLDCCVASCEGKSLPPSRRKVKTIVHSWSGKASTSISGSEFFEESELKIVLEDFKQKHSEEKYGWIDSVLISIVLQVAMKYFFAWLVEYFTVEIQDV